MGKEEYIDLGLGNIWKAWFAFVKGKRKTPELHEFQYYLERNLFKLHRELNTGVYKPSPQRTFIVHDNKRREIAVSPVKDRVVHRLLYDFLVPIWDRHFIFDAWSCRKGKGLLGAIQRAQSFLHKNPHAYIWRADIKKFFDHVHQPTLFSLLKRRVFDPKALSLLHKIIFPINEGGDDILKQAFPLAI